MIGPIVFNSIIMVLSILFFRKDKKRFIESFSIAKKSFLKIAPLISIVLIILVFIQALFSDDVILTYLSAAEGTKGYILAVLLGAVIHIPHFVAFPIGGQLLQEGIDPGFIGVFITSLVTVHTFSIPLEVKELGLKFTAVRNLLYLLASIIIGIFIGVLF